jgi:acetyltransferase-like isoleucine patch superfamily enzyme
VLFGPNVVIMDCDGHRINRELAETEGDFPEDIRPVEICRGCWVGYGALILKGVTLGEYSVVAANSVVTKSVPPYTLVGGNPARVIRSLKTSQQEG